MVDAVGPSQDDLPVSLKFSIRDRPEVGHDDEIDYALIPRVPGLETLRLVFRSLNGLEVVTQGPSLAGVRPAIGTPILGSVTVRPVKAGLFTLTATVVVQSPSQSASWPFSIPVIAGEGPAQTADNQQP